MKIVDTHAHVNKWSYEDELSNVIKKMIEKEVYAYNIGTNLDDCKTVIELARQYENLLPVIGIHPEETRELEEDWFEKLEAMIDDDIAAIGEIGLDYHYPPFNKEEQAKIFIKQIELAGKYNLPIVVHTRDSLEDCYEIVKNYPEQKFLFHSWSGDEELTKKYMSISDNIYFSYNGILTFKNAQLQQEVIKTIPLNRLMFETDCPFLSPMPKRGKTNYPWRTKHTIEYAAELLGLSINELNDSNWKVAKDFYKH